MMAHNLCYTSLVPSHEIGKYPKEILTKTPNGDYFVRKEHHKGLLPMILEELIAARKKARAELA